MNRFSVACVSAVLALRPLPAIAADAPVGPGCDLRSFSGSAIEASAAAVVRISGRRHGWPVPGTQTSGSGVIIGADGLVITSAHVIEDAGGLEISGPSLPASTPMIVIIDRSADVALLRITSPSPCFLGLSHSLARPGDAVFAIGFPFGATRTIAKGRITAMPPPQTEIASVPGLIRTDASIAPGDSGGALVAADGTLVGVITARYRDASASGETGFAIPTATIRRLIGQAESSVEPGPGSAPTLTRLAGRQPLGGADVTTLSAPLALQRGVDPAVKGVLIVGPGEGYAAQAGFIAGDVITQVNSRAITSVDDLIAVMNGARSWRITIQRGNDTLTGAYNDDAERK